MGLIEANRSLSLHLVARIGATSSQLFFLTVKVARILTYWDFPAFKRLKVLSLGRNYLMVPETGIEPVRTLFTLRRILSPMCLPISPLGPWVHLPPFGKCGRYAIRSRFYPWPDCGSASRPRG